MSEQPRYSMVIEWSGEDQTYIVSFPEWEAQGLIGHTHGDTYEEAARKGQEVLHMLVESARAEGEPLPTPQGPWPGECRGAVSLTFDDGMRSQLETAIPLLDAHGLRATFYLNPPRDGDEAAWRAKLAPWRAAAGRGHEIGNHSLTHPCSQNFELAGGTVVFASLGLESMTLEDIERDVLEAERRLRIGIPEQAVRSFGYPCYQSYVGAGASRQSYVPVIARHFVAARGKGEKANHPARCDLHDLWSWPAERMSGAELVGLAERAAAEGRWAVFTFHGIDEGHLPVAAVDLAELCGFLARHRKRLWTAPVAVAAQRVIEWRKEKG